MTIIHASSSGRSLDRDSITIGAVAQSVQFHRASHPTIFAGFQLLWFEAEADGVSFDFNAGAGVGSRYATLRVEVDGREPVYEYLDLSEIVSDRVHAIVTEQRTLTSGVCSDCNRPTPWPCPGGCGGS